MSDRNVTKSDSINSEDKEKEENYYLDEIDESDEDYYLDDEIDEDDEDYFLDDEEEEEEDEPSEESEQPDDGKKPSGQQDPAKTQVMPDVIEIRSAVQSVPQPGPEAAIIMKNMRMTLILMRQMKTKM